MQPGSSVNSRPQQHARIQHNYTADLQRITEPRRQESSGSSQVTFYFMCVLISRKTMTHFRVQVILKSVNDDIFCTYFMLVLIQTKNLNHYKGINGLDIISII